MAGSLRDRLLGRAAPGITTIRPTPNENGKAPPAPEVEVPSDGASSGMFTPTRGDARR